MARERAEITKSAKKITKRIFAIEAAESAIPPNPRTPAIMATIRKVKDQFNIEYSVRRPPPDRRRVECMRGAGRRYIVLM